MNQSSFDFGKIESSTPMMKQYLTVKAAHMDCILFYRMGDFYEMFYEDAVSAANILGIALTKRGKHNGQDIPMCGIPYHASSSYIKELITAGYKVAICEQIESPEEAKKRGYKSVVNREVVRIITPGTITEENILTVNRPNFLVSVVITEDKLAIAYADISTGEIYVSNIHISFLAHELSRLHPSEIICSEKLMSNSAFTSQISHYKDIISLQVNSFFDLNKTGNRFCAFYKLQFIESIGDFTKPEIQAIGSLLEYINLTQKKEISILSYPKHHMISQFMVIDPLTRRSLELTESNSNKLDSSLLSCIDETKTRQGSRLLFQYLANPLIDPKIINSRLDLIALFVKNHDFLNDLQNILSKINDTQRCVTKLLMGRGNPRDLIALCSDIEQFSALRSFIYKNFDYTGNSLESYLDQLNGLDHLAKIIRDRISNNAPLQLGEGGFIKEGVDNKLDELKSLKQNADNKITELKRKYINHTGINNLKIAKNNIIGYFIEVSPTQLSKIDNNVYILRQSMVNTSRFTTSELRELEDQINTAGSQIVTLELELFQEIILQLQQYFENVMLASSTIAVIDVVANLAKLAVENNYTRPTITEDLSFILTNARHPVVEKFTTGNSGRFTPNDTALDADSSIILITGPNMAGKSTYLRQNAICAVLAQIGSYVPADHATIGIVDRIFSRIGAYDSLAEGKSTFMVEMVETAAILNQATHRSFVILDEIGRGTSTYDGVSIARSVIEYLAEKIKCRTLFATHYHELASLETTFPAVTNYTMSIKEWDGKIIFLHKVIKGVADKSYGIHVAALAGFPHSVITRANQVLEGYEKHGSPKREPQLILNEQTGRLAHIISEIELDELTPKQALDIIYQLKQCV